MHPVAGSWSSNRFAVEKHALRLDVVENDVDPEVSGDPPDAARGPVNRERHRRA